MLKLNGVRPRDFFIDGITLEAVAGKIDTMEEDSPIADSTKGVVDVTLPDNKTVIIIVPSGVDVATSQSVRPSTVMVAVPAGMKIEIQDG